MFETALGVFGVVIVACIAIVAIVSAVCLSIVLVKDTINLLQGKNKDW